MSPEKLNAIASRLGETLTSLHRILVRKGFEGSYTAFSLYARDKRDPGLKTWMQIDKMLRDLLTERGIDYKEFEFEPVATAPKPVNPRRRKTSTSALASQNGQ